MPSLLIHFTVFIVYFGALGISFLHATPWSYIQFVLGGLLGFSLLFLDRIFHGWYSSSVYAQKVREIISSHGMVTTIRFIAKTKDKQKKLITRSIVFLLTYFPIALFVLTSAESYVGSGLVLGLGLHIVIDLLRYFRISTEVFHRMYLWQVTRKLEHKELQIVVGIYIVFFLFITFLFVV